MKNKKVPISEEGQQRHREQKVGRIKFFREKNIILTQFGHIVNYVAGSFGCGIFGSMSWHTNLIYKPAVLVSSAPICTIFSYDF